MNTVSLPEIFVCIIFIIIVIVLLFCFEMTLNNYWANFIVCCKAKLFESLKTKKVQYRTKPFFSCFLKLFCFQALQKYNNAVNVP